MAKPTDGMKSAGNASAATLAALGILAYVAETLLHEAGGHGTVCLLTGGQIVVLAPLYMRCSVRTMILNVAGPAANIVAGAISLGALHAFRGRSGALRYFIWLSLVFNWLVAAGYLMVGATTGFGDWGAIFASVVPAWLWRVPAAALGAVCYFGALAQAIREARRFIGGHPSNAALRRLVLIPATSASVVALGAEVYGQGGRALGLALAAACTLVVGLSLIAYGSGSSRLTIEQSKLDLGFRPVLVTIAILVAIVFVFVVGPGVTPVQVL